jgi:transcriptional regulator with XRE-family HTH domain
MSPSPPFARVVAEAMRRGGLGLREVSRRARVDPSLLSKVLAGKRNPPSDEETLRRLAEALGTDPIELIVSAGLIPSAWSALWGDVELVRAVHRLAGGAAAARAAPARPVEPAAERPRAARPAARPSGLSEELL